MPEALEGLDSAELLLMVEDKAESSAVILTEPSNQIWGLFPKLRSVVQAEAAGVSWESRCTFTLV